MNGSHHEWFEDRGEKGCLMDLVDDATGITLALISKEETTQAAYRKYCGGGLRSMVFRKLCT
jgi:hypothetical protein